MKKNLVVFFLMFLIIQVSAEWISLNDIEKSDVFTISSGNSKTDILFTLDGFELSEVDENSYSIGYQNEKSLSNDNNFNRFQKMIAIPYGATIEMNYETQATRKISSIKIKDHTLKDEDSWEFFAIDRPAVQISEVATIRDIEVVTISINPFEFDDENSELFVHHEIRIQLNYQNGADQIHAPNRKMSRFFEPLYRSVIANYEDIELRSDEYQTPSYLFIYINDSQVGNTLRTLIQWKRQIGFEVTAVSTADTGTSTSSIKNYIQNAYNTWENPPEFICLVGDANGSNYIPTYFQNSGEGDHYYTQLSGNDILADAFIGRLSIGTHTDLQTIISKILNYEKQPYTGNPDWFERALLIGDPSSSGQTTITLSKYVKETILQANPEFEFVEGYSGNFVSTISNAINQGVSYFNYRGFAGMSGWYNTNTSSLNNGYMLPFVMHLTCNTGNFASYEDARSEIFLRAGTPSNPKGAIAAVGTATPNTHTTFNNIVSGGTFYGIFVDGLNTPGAALTRGKIALYHNYPNNPMNAVNNFSYWNNLMGDPGLALWTAEPKNLNVEYPETIAVGANYIDVIVSDDFGNLLEDVWVNLLYEDNSFISGFTNENGKVTLSIAAEEADEIILTATKKNFIPKTYPVSIQMMSQFVSIEDYQIIDDNSGSSSGNGNEELNPAETIELKPKIKNHGTGAISPLTAMITTDNEYISILSNEISYDSIEAAQSAFPNSNFLLDVAENAPNLMNVDFLVTFSDENRNVWQDMIQIQLQAAELITTSQNVIDNNNGIADPGEEILLKLTLQNIGDISCENVLGILSTNSNLIDISETEASFGSIAPGAVASNNNSLFSLYVKPITLPGKQIPIQLHLYNGDGFEQTVHFLLDIGTVNLTDPFGPDDYGYYAYDDGDLNYQNTPVYNWYEIDPSYGGDGTVLSMNDNGDNGDLADVSLPFLFSFYGITYDMITICSNGFIVPGGTENYSYMNRTLPGPTSPAPLIAPFWDDLKMGSGKICYYYDSEMHIFIVQWSRLQNDFDNSEETFQVIFYHPSYYPSSNADGIFSFQYKTINNTNQGQYSGYSVQHGQYATVGIQDHTGTKGLQYTFNNMYPTPAKPLENDMAILFTGEPIPYQEAFLVLGGMNIINDDNNQLDYGEQADINIILNNIGEVDAENVSVTISTTDSYLNIVANSAYYGTIEAESSSVGEESFTISVSDQVPNGHMANILVSITSNNGIWELILSARLHAPEIIFSDLFINDGDNFMLDAGETSDVFVLLENFNGSPLENVSATLHSLNSLVSVNQNTDSISFFDGDISESFRFNVTASSAISIGQIVGFELDIEADNYQETIPFNLSIGLSVEDFESGSFASYPWVFSGTGQWQIDTSAYEGMYSARSADINDNQSSSIKITVQYSQPGEISFYKRVSSENNYDYFSFRINGQLKDEWSGEVPWAQHSYTVPAGTNELEWRYDKDFMISSGQDCAWIDYIEFPLNTELDEPVLEFSETNLDLEIPMGEQQIEKLAISNTGQIVSEYFIITEPEQELLDWLSISPASGYVMESESDIINLQFDTNSLNEGEYVAELIIFDDFQEYSIPISLHVTGTDADAETIPAVTKLLGNYPNPFNPETKISYSLDSNQAVEIIVYNIKGQKVKTLVNEEKKGGYHQVIWNGKDERNRGVSSGVYFYQLKTEKNSSVNKMLLIK